MKKINQLYTAVLITTLFGVLTGCKKFDDIGQPYPEDQLRSCGIEEFIFEAPHRPTDTLSISYNSNGDPVKITRTTPTTGFPDYIFKYKNNRLSEFIGVYKNGTSTEVWHKYIYGAGGLVAIDSVYTFAQIVNGKPHEPIDRYAITFNYDSRGRIIYEKWTYEDGYIYEQHYEYTADGNLTGASYGNKVSFRRSNKIWMFLDRNYSVNDHLNSSDFNSLFMPKNIELGLSQDAFLGNYYSKAKLEYRCP
ncbi:MAG: hypothetical protein ABW007_22855 [Chitinophagaceae bacterium]